LEAPLRLTIGKTFFKLGNLAEAEKHLGRAVKLRRQALGQDDPRTLAAQEAFADFLNRGPRRHEEAEPLARQTWEARARVLGPEHPDTLDSLDTYATALRGLGRAPEAEDHHRKCLAARRRVLAPDHRDTLVSMNNLATVLCDQGKFTEAVDLNRQVLKARRDKGPPTDESVCNSVCNLANTLRMDGQLRGLEGAEQLLRDNVDWVMERFGRDDPQHTVRMKGLLARVLIEEGRMEKGIDLARKVVTAYQKIYKEPHPQATAFQVDLGHGLVLLRQYEDAQRVLAKALEIFHVQANVARFTGLGPAWAKCWYGASLTGLGRFEEAVNPLMDAERDLRASSTPRGYHLQAVKQLVEL
jgi:tetratricopeptide (TPR) repeat protein